MTSEAYLQRIPISGSMRSCFQPLPASQRANVVRIPLVFKPDAVRLGLAGKILRSLAEQLKAQGVAFRFTAPCLFQPTRELIDHLYFEHSGLNPAQNFDKTGKPAKFYEKMYGKYMAGELPEGEGIQMPLISVIVETRAGAGFDTRSLINIMRRLIGETNPLALIRDPLSAIKDPAECERIKNDPAERKRVIEEERAKIRYAHTTKMGARQTPVMDETGYNIEAYSLYNRIHCPQAVDEARIQLGLIYSQTELGKSLESHYDKGTIEQVAGSLPRLNFAAKPLLDCFEGDPAKTADSLIDDFPALKHMSHYEVELLVREFNLLAGYFLEQEHDFYESLGLQGVKPLAERVTERTLPTPVIYLLAGASGVGKSTLIEALRKEGLVDASFPQYTNCETSAGRDRVTITSEDAVELCGQNAILALQSAPGAPAYFFLERVFSGFATVHGGRAVFDAGEDQIRDIQAWAGREGVVVRTGCLGMSNRALKARILADTTRDRRDRIEGSLATNQRLQDLGFSAFDKRFRAQKTPAELVADFRQWIAATERPGAKSTDCRLPEREHDTPQLFMLRELFKSLYHDAVDIVNKFHRQKVSEWKKEEEAAALVAAKEKELEAEEKKEEKTEAAEDDGGLPGMESDDLPGIEPAEDDGGLPGMESVASDVPVVSPGVPAVPLAADMTRMQAATVDNLQVAFEKGLFNYLTLVYYEAFRYWHEIPPETNDQLAYMVMTANHVTQSLAAAMQGQLSEKGMIGARRKLSRFLNNALYSGFSVAQILNVGVPMVNWLRGLFQGKDPVPVHYEETLLDMLGHDLGKPDRPALHERSSAELLKRMNLPAYQDSFLIGRDPIRMELVPLVAAHHHMFGNTFMPDCSLRDMLTTFEDQEVRARLSSQSGAIDLKVTQIFIKRLLLAALCDVAGASGEEDGILAATGVVTYRRAYELMNRLAEQHRKSYDAFLAALTEVTTDPLDTRRRFAMAPARCDRLMDSYESGDLDIYWEMVNGKAQELIAGREITAADWEQAQRLAPRIRKIEYFTSYQFSVTDPLTGDLPEGLSPNGGRTETRYLKINPNYIKYRVLFGRIAEAIGRAHGKDANLIFESEGRLDGVFGSRLNNLLNTTPVRDLTVSCEARELKIVKAGGETVLAGTIEQEPYTVLVTFKI